MRTRARSSTETVHLIARAVFNLVTKLGLKREAQCLVLP